MKWIKSDLERYVQAKEYIDTLIIPLLPFQLNKPDDELTKNAFQCEVLSIFVNELEKELAGRLLLMPHYYYLKSTNKDIEVDRINTWVQDARNQPIKQVFFITFDSSWKKIEKDLEGILLWLPGTHSGDIHSKEMSIIIRDQVEQVGELIQSYW